MLIIMIKLKKILNKGLMKLMIQMKFKILSNSQAKLKCNCRNNIDY